MTILRSAQALPGSDLLKQILGSLLRSGAPKILLWGPALHTFWNDAYSTLDPAVEMSRSGESFASLMPDVWEQIREPLNQALQGTERLSAQICLGQSERRSAPLAYTAHLTPLYGDGPGAQGVLLDVHESTADKPLSERLLVEKRQMQQLFGELPVLMAYGRGRELRLQFVNTAFRRFFGFRPLEGLRASEAIPEVVKQGFDAVLQEVLSSGQPYIGQGTEVRVRSEATEDLRYVDFMYQPVRNSRGEIEGVLCTGVDVTHQHRLAIESDRLKRRALHASRINAMGTMAMTLAHELNQPLAAAASFLAAARRYMRKSGTIDEQGLSMLDLGTEQIRRAGLIIQRAKPLLQAGEASRRRVNLHDAIDRAVSLIAAGRDLKLVITRDIPKHSDAVCADEIQLEQVLVNLFRNAADASRQAARKEIIVSSRAVGGSRIRIGVRDFGKGLNEQDLEDIFELGRSRSGSGLGLGLPLCRTLLEANGGALWAANAPGGGAEFFLELERASAKARDAI